MSKSTHTVSALKGEIVRLTSRDLKALVAAREGRVRSVLHRSYSNGKPSEYLRPECNDSGVGYATLSKLQEDWRIPPLIEACVEEGPLALTTFGNEVLDRVLALNGVEAVPADA